MIAVSKDLTKIIVYEIYHRFKARTLFHTNVYINGSGNDFNRLRQKKKKKKKNFIWTGNDEDMVTRMFYFGKWCILQISKI